MRATERRDLGDHHTNGSGKGYRSGGEYADRLSDFASPVSGLSEDGADATNKWPGETDREWGRPIQMDEKVRARVDEIWDELAIFSGREPTL